MTIVPIAVELIRPLRHAVLRDGLPPEAAVFEGDDEPASRHWAAIDDDGKVIGCATVVRRPFDGKPAWQLRGMAVDPKERRGGIGRALLRAAEEYVQSTDGASLLWCNARTPAVPFYQRASWAIVSAEFHVETAGPHRRMIRQLEPTPGVDGA